MDTFEQRLMADLADAAEAAVDRGLTPPDRAAVAASVARRHQRRRVQVFAGIAAVVVALAGLAAVLTGGAGTDRTEMRPPATEPTAPPATSRPSPTPTTPGDSTATTPPDTATTDATATDPTTTPDTPNDPEAPGDVPNPLPVTADEMLAVGANFDALPPACRAYWEGTSRTPEDNGLDRTQNLLELYADGITIADLNGDGVDDGIATYICATGGTIPPDGVVVMLAVEGDVESERQVLFDQDQLSAQHEAQFGDGRARVSEAPTVVTSPEGETLIQVSLLSYRQPDPNCCASARAVAEYAMAGDSLQLVSLNPA